MDPQAPEPSVVLTPVFAGEQFAGIADAQHRAAARGLAAAGRD